MDRPTTALEHHLLTLGLDPEEVQRHQRLLTEAVREGRKPTFSIIDTCRLDNGGLLILPPTPATSASGSSKPSENKVGRGYVAFVLAAGAASRYSQPLFGLISAIEEQRTEDIVRHLSDLAAEGALSWPMPPSLSALVANPAAGRQLTAEARAQLAHDLQLPKALMPCVREGTSFLTLKHWEHGKIPGLSGEIFITPPGQTHNFAEALAAIESSSAQHRAPFTTQFLEQGPRLSTIRFYRDGRPVIGSEGEPSLVPAGHGAIARLFPEAGQLFPDADSLFIRNIDNVMGTTSEAIDATTAFLGMHRQLLTAVRRIRQALADHQINVAAATATQLMKQYLPTAQPSATPHHQLSAAAATAELWRLQTALFHAPVTKPLSTEYLRELFARPVNLMGQVPNIHNDVGGTPCFIKEPHSTAVEPSSTATSLKICLEAPHASAADRQQFLANQQIATHFNPGFCAVEITKDPAYYSKLNQDFWLMAEKNYRGEPVTYFETVLYEILGNSSFANTVFVAVPRCLFNPHKALRDAMNQELKTWLRQ
jgi:hypothetical protein